MKFKLLVCFAFLCFSVSLAQPDGVGPKYTSTNKKAIKYLEEGKAAFETKRDAQSEKYLLKALEEDNNFVEAALGLANLYQVTNRHAEAIKYFKRAIEINPKFFPNAFYFVALSYLTTGQYDDAKINLENFLKFERINPNTKEQAQRYLLNATFGSNALKNPKPFNPVNVGPGVNTETNEYFATITGDGRQLYFTRDIPFPEMPEMRNEDFFFSTKSADGVWQPALPVKEINSYGNEGAPSISVDGTIMFFASCSDETGNYGAPDRKGYGSCDIFYSQKIGGRWTKPRNAGPAVNSSNWETQPCFSSDGKTLYFIRGIVVRGGIREQDIYTSTIGEDGKFTTAVKLSTVINSPYREESVFIHPDNQTLYFSSEGWPGMGGLDIFVSKRLPTGEWGTPVNLGYPINTFGDENSLLVDPNGKLAYFSSDRKGGEGSLDIYQFELPPELRPQKITYVIGKVYDAKTKDPLEANFELVDLETQQTITRSYSQKNGEFLVTLASNKNYMVNVNREGYLFYSDNFSLKGKEADFNKPYRLDIPLERIDTSIVVELKNVFFDVGKWDLKPESRAELDKLVGLLNKNPRLKIEISGHTDNSGDKKANITLSGNRAKAVYDYVVVNGKVDATRLTYKGYGDTKPKVPNDSAENMARNRRTEFRVLAK